MAPREKCAGDVEIGHGVGTHDFDEVTMPVGSIHLERMSSGNFWIGLETPDGHLYHVNLWLEKRTIHGRCEYQGKFPPRAALTADSARSQDQGAERAPLDTEKSA
jgi:hypothetical protein